MTFVEAKEHVKGRLHELFTDPYQAFENSSSERELHIKVALYMLLARPMVRGQVTLRIVHGWENGRCEPSELEHLDYPLVSLEDFRAAASGFGQSRQSEPTPSQAGTLLAIPLDDAIARAEAKGVALDPEIHSTPARWPAFEDGLALYTQFKMYHRLVYGEDDTYRCSLCETALGLREIHEFHLEEGEFALLTPLSERSEDTQQTLLILHESQLGPIEQLFEQSLPLLER